jgi:hypothetical protein
LNWRLLQETQGNITYRFVIFILHLILFGSNQGVYHTCTFRITKINTYESLEFWLETRREKNCSKDTREFILKLILKKHDWKCELDWSDWRWETVACFCQHGNEPSASINVGVLTSFSKCTLYLMELVIKETMSDSMHCHKQSNPGTLDLCLLNRLPSQRRSSRTKRLKDITSKTFLFL